MERERRARLPWAIVLLILALSCAIAIAAARIFVNATTRTVLHDAAPARPDSVQSVQTVGDGFVYYDGNSIVAVDSDGRIRWSYLVGSGASYDARDAGVASWVGRTLMLLDGRNRHSRLQRHDAQRRRLRPHGRAVRRRAARVGGQRQLDRPDGDRRHTESTPFP